MDEKSDIKGVMDMPVSKRDRAIVGFLSSHPWAIMPSALETIVNVVADHIEGKPVQLASSESKIVSHLDFPQVAIVEIVGTIAKRLYGLDAISGGQTTIGIQSEIQEALDNPKISAIVLKVDSPGGTVDGTKELADFVHEATKIKPIVAYADGLMASAAYWIGSAANKVVAFDTSQVGSIGVIVTHFDQSQRMSFEGIKATHIFAGKYKAFGNSTEPLSAEAERYIQERIDTYYTLFVDGVALYRNVDAKTVIQNMAEGRIFIGQQAKIAGLVDEVGNIETAINLALAELEEGENAMATKEELQEMSQEDAIKALVEAHPEGLPAELLAMVADTPKEPEIPEAAKVVIAELKEKLEAAELAVQTSEQSIAEKEVVDAKEAKHIEVMSALAPFKLDQNEALVALGEELDTDKFNSIVSVVETLYNKSKVLTDKLKLETPGANGQDSDVPDVTTQDEATAYIQKRDKIEDIEEAVDKAALEFPSLFAKE